NIIFHFFVFFLSKWSILLTIEMNWEEPQGEAGILPASGPEQRAELRVAKLSKREAGNGREIAASPEPGNGATRTRRILSQPSALVRHIFDPLLSPAKKFLPRARAYRPGAFLQGR